MSTPKAPPWVRLAVVYREKGPGGVWFGVLGRLGYRRLALLERRLDGPVAPTVPRVAASVRPLGAGDAVAFAALGQSDAATFRERLDRGHRCWGAWCSGTLRHVAWIGFSEVRVEALPCRLLLDDGVAYVYRAFTDPEYRRLGLLPAAQAACLEALRGEGVRLALAAVLPDNPWAFPPWLKVGFRRVGTVRAIGGPRRPRVFVSLASGAASGGWRFVRAAADAPR